MMYLKENKLLIIKNVSNYYLNKNFIFNNHSSIYNIINNRYLKFFKILNNNLNINLYDSKILNSFLKNT